MFIQKEDTDSEKMVKMFEDPEILIGDEWISLSKLKKLKYEILLENPHIMGIYVH